MDSFPNVAYAESNSQKLNAFLEDINVASLAKKVTTAITDETTAKRTDGFSINNHICCIYSLSFGHFPDFLFLLLPYTLPHKKL